MAKPFANVKVAITEEDICLVGKYALEKKTWGQLAVEDVNYVLWCIGHFDDKFDYKFIQLVIRKAMARAKEQDSITLPRARRKSKYHSEPPWYDDPYSNEEMMSARGFFDIPF